MKYTRQSLISLFQQRAHIIWPAFLIFIAVISHAIWFNPFAAISHGDFTYWPASHAVEGWRSWGTWLSSDGFGDVNIQIPFLFMISIWSLIANLGLNYQVSIMVSLLIPIAIAGFLAPYYLLSKEFKSRSIGVAGALFYGSGIYFLIRQTAHLNICIVYALAPLVVLMFKNALETKSRTKWLQFTLMFFVITLYEIRIALLVGIVLMCYLVASNKNKLSYYLVYWPPAVGILIGLSMFWLLPTILGGAATSISDTANRGLFGNNLFDLAHALAISDSSWTGGAPNEDFIKQAVPIQAWVFALLAFGSSVLVYKFKRQRRSWICFLILALIGIFLTKQSVDPIPEAYKYFYTHVPGFSLFREASKFYILTAFAYMMLICIALRLIKEKLHKGYYGAALLIVLACSLANLSPLINQSIKSTFISRTIPATDTAISKIISSETAFGRTLWVPTEGRWAEYSNLHPKLGAAGTIASAWPHSSETSAETGIASADGVLEFLKKPIAQYILNDSSIKWLTVPTIETQSDNNSLKYFGNDAKLFTETLKQISWLSPIKTDPGKTSLFINTGAKEYFSTVGGLIKLGDKTQLNDAFDFVERQLQIKDFGTTDRDIPGAGYVNQTMNGLTQAEITAKGPKVDFDATTGQKLSIDKTQSVIGYNLRDKELTFFAAADPVIKINSTNIKSSSKSSGTIKTTSLKAGSKYYTSHGDKVDKIDAGDNMRNLGLVTDSLTLWEKRATTPISASQPAQSAEKCSQYKDQTNAKNVMEPSTDGTIAGIKLESTGVPACAAVSSDAAPGGMYILEFDYKVLNTHGISYSTEGSVDSKFTRKLITSDDANWHTHRQLIDHVNAGQPMSAVFFGYADDRGSGLGRSEFRNISISATQNAGLIFTPKDQWDISGNLVQGNNTVEINDMGVENKNAVLNPGFEQGLWSEKVSDCFHQDDRPKIGMELSDQTRDNTGKSLLLYAQHHEACTRQKNIQVKENAVYVFSLDFQSSNARNSGYSLFFDDPDNTVITDTLPIKDKSWHNLTKKIRIPNRAKTVTVELYSYADENSTVKYINKYDNVGLTEIPEISMHIFNGIKPVEKRSSNIVIRSDLRGPTKKTLKIKNVTNSFNLRMAEKHNPNWRLEINNKKIHGLGSWLPSAKPDAIPDADHFKLNDFENGWYVDVDKFCKQQNLCKQNADGSYDMEMVAEFTPQRWFYIGLVISGLTLAGCLGYLGWYWRRARRRRNGGGHTPRPRPLPTEPPVIEPSRTTGPARRVVRRSPRQINLRDEPPK